MLSHSARLMGLVPEVVTDALSAANSHDVDRFARCFTRTGVLDAWGMLFEGTASISSWTERWVVAYHVRFTDLLHVWDDTSVAVHSQVHGQGYNGPATLTFSMRDQRIEALRIT